MTSEPRGRRARSGRLARGALAVAGLAGLLGAILAAPADAREALDQDWAPFVLVAGLLLLGLVAARDGLFEAAGRLVARTTRRGPSLFAAAGLLVALVAAVLNLDTAVVFLTPVLLVAARSRDRDEAPFLYLSVFLANAASLILPGSNLTNLIVVSAGGGRDRAYPATMALPWLAAVVTVSLVLGLVFRHALAGSGRPTVQLVRPRAVEGAIGVVVAVVAMVVLPAGPMALVVLGTGLLAVARRSTQGRLGLADLGSTLDLSVLVGLFGLAVALGVLGRSWNGPEHLLHQAGTWETAGLAALASVLVNNLPAASLLAARPVPHPHALLLGLDLGPNLAVTGALSAVLWLRAARSVGAKPSIGRFSLLGLVVVPLSLAASLLALGLVT